MKIIGVQIVDMDNDGDGYIAKTRKDCHDKIDAMVFDNVMRTKSNITQGWTIGIPMWE